VLVLFSTCKHTKETVNVPLGYSCELSKSSICVFVVIFWHDSLNLLVYKHTELTNMYALNINMVNS
jgi:sRNA-binding regulator protein Hfq